LLARLLRWHARVKAIISINTLILAAPLFGCTAPLHVPTPVPVKPTESYAASAERFGFSVAAEPFDTDTSARTFGSENLLRQFTPILLVVENQAAEKLHLHRSNAKLECADGKILHAVSALAMYEQLREGPSGGGAPAFAGNLWYIYVLENNDRQKTDWMAKEFPHETILTTNRRTAGFLYFRGTCQKRTGRKLHITADKLTSPDAIQVALDLT
jgi:hypothetical protein